MSRSFGQRLAGFFVVPPVKAFLANRTQEYQRLKNHQGHGIIVVANHITEIDPLVIGVAIHQANFDVHFLAKDSLFQIPVLGKIIGALKQIPVERKTAGAGKSLQAAQEALDQGGAIMIYPEGTLTRDPELWPMRGHTGAARLALKTKAPVVPLAHDGAQNLLGQYAKKFNVFPRKQSTVRIGPDVDLSDLYDQPLTRGLLEEATERMMAAITAELEIIRGQQAPEGRWNNRTGRYETPDGEAIP